MKINESSLTGESEAVEKTADVIPEENVALGDLEEHGLFGIAGDPMGVPPQW